MESQPCIQFGRGTSEAVETAVEVGDLINGTEKDQFQEPNRHLEFVPPSHYYYYDYYYHPLLIRHIN